MLAWEGQPGKDLHFPQGEGNGEKGGVENPSRRRLTTERKKVRSP